MSKRSKKSFNKRGKKLFDLALDDLFFFDDDKIEELLDKALLKFWGQPDWRKATRSYIWGFQDIRNRICQVAAEIYAPITIEQKETNNDHQSTDLAA
jgi:hypothetical protein